MQPLTPAAAAYHPLQAGRWPQLQLLVPLLPQLLLVSQLLLPVLQKCLCHSSSSSSSSSNMRLLHQHLVMKVLGLAWVQHSSSQQRLKQ